jgi:5'-3' exonuclease
VRLHLIDGTYELFRAHFSRRPGVLDAAGKDVKATVGFASSMLALLHDEKEAITHAAVAFDNPIRSFRNDLFDGYKSDEGVPAELLAQFDLVEEAARALGLAVWSMREHEADDGLATGAARFAGEVEQVRILSPDKDLGQCIRGTQVVQVDRRQEKVTDEAALRALRGVGPAQVPELLALIGDAADGIPGLPGFGEKSAAAVLAAFGRIEDIPLDPSAWPPGVRGAARLAGVLAGMRPAALLYRKLATLVTDAPVSASLEATRWAGVPREAFLAFCGRVGSTSLRDRPRRWA